MLKNNKEVLDIFKLFCQMIEIQFSITVKILQFDNGDEYDDKKFQEFFNANSLIRERYCTHTLLQNGVTKRKNQNILETTRALQIRANVSRRYWSDSIITTIHLLNRLPSKAIKFQTPL